MPYTKILKLWELQYQRRLLNEFNYCAFKLPYQSEFCIELSSLNNFDRASCKKPLCQILSNLVVKEKMLFTPGDHKSSPKRTLCAQVS